MSDYSKYRNRREQANQREEAIPKFIEELQETKTKAIEIREKMPWVTEQEQTDVIEKIDETREWLNGKIEEQAALAADEEPAFTVDEIEGRMKKVNALSKKVFSKKKPREPKKKKEEEKTEDGEAEPKKEGEEDVINLDDEQFDKQEGENQEKQEEL